MKKNKNSFFYFFLYFLLSCLCIGLSLFLFFNISVKEEVKGHSLSYKNNIRPSGVDWELLKNEVSFLASCKSFVDYSEDFIGNKGIWENLIKADWGKHNYSVFHLRQQESLNRVFPVLFFNEDQCEKSSNLAEQLERASIKKTSLNLSSMKNKLDLSKSSIVNIDMMIDLFVSDEKSINRVNTEPKLDKVFLEKKDFINEYLNQGFSKNINGKVFIILSYDEMIEELVDRLIKLSKDVKSKISIILHQEISVLDQQFFWPIRNGASVADYTNLKLIRDSHKKLVAKLKSSFKDNFIMTGELFDKNILQEENSLTPFIYTRYYHDELHISPLGSRLVLEWINDKLD